jgi:hypothetical protein
MSGPFDPRAPACAWLEDGHAEDWSRGGCLDAPSGGACAYREPEDDDPYLLLLRATSRCASDSGTSFIESSWRPPVLEHTTAASGNPPRTAVDRSRLCEMPVPSAALDALEAAIGIPGDGFVPAAASRIIDLVKQGASASILAADGSKLLHLFCRRFEKATPAQLAVLVIAHPAQRVAVDYHGRTPLQCLVLFAADLTPEVLIR